MKRYLMAITMMAQPKPPDQLRKNFQHIIPPTTTAFAMMKTVLVLIAYIVCSLTMETLAFVDQGGRRDFSRSSYLAHASCDCVSEINSHIDWMELLDDEESITLVWFKAPFCKACKRFEKDWKSKVIPMAREHSKDLQLATVDFNNNRALFRELNIKHLPTVQFYHRGGQLLTSYSLKPKEFQRVMDSISYYMNTSPAELGFESSLEGKRLSLEEYLMTVHGDEVQDPSPTFR